MKIYLYNSNTCTRVKLYGEDVKNMFTINGAEMTDNIEEADYVFVNTCSFLKSRSDYFLSFIKDLKEKLSSTQKLVIIGCLGATNYNEITDISPDILIYKRDLSEIQRDFNLSETPKSMATNVSEKLPPSKAALNLFNKYVLKSKHIDFRLKKDSVCYIQISTGCCGNCSYCSEKYITKLKSRPIDEIVEAVKDGIDREFTLFSLSSDDASAYGKDIGFSLENLLEELAKIENKNIYFIIPEFNPQGLTDKVIGLLKDRKFLYITVPIQSGSQDILDKMNRPYNIDDIYDRVSTIKKNNPDMMINTHVIVGFPTETEEDFNKTKELLETGVFDRVKVFMYSDRPNTVASQYPDDLKITEEVKKQRMEEILKTVRKSNMRKLSLTNLILNLEQIKD